MHESFWSVFVIASGIVILSAIYVFQSITNTDEHNYHLLKETTEAAMYDAIDWYTYKKSAMEGQKPTIRINREKFVENFIRRFAENANLSRNYRIEIYDINETPPKVSLQVSAKGLLPSDSFSLNGEKISFELTNRLDAIMETTDVKA